MAGARTAAVLEAPATGRGRTRKSRPSPAQAAWLGCGLKEPGGKLPLFDRQGQRVNPRTIQSCIEQGWAEPWIANPIKPDWQVCKLTAAGRAALS